MMMGTTTYDEFNALAGSHQHVIVHKTISNTAITALQAFEVLTDINPHAVLFECHPDDPGHTHHTYIGINPRAQLQIEEPGDVHAKIRSFYLNQRAVGVDIIPGFAGGVFGFFSYESSALFEEKLKFRANDFPEIVLTAYQDHLIFDHQSKYLIIATIVTISHPDHRTLYDTAMSQINSIEHAVQAQPSIKAPVYSCSEFRTQFSDEEYIKAGRVIQKHIQAGDAFQIVLARTFEQDFTARPLELLKVLQQRNPSHYMFLFTHGDYTFCGASPETMISVRNGYLESRPLAGTRPRGPGYDDEKQAQNLLSDSKEVAEHMMLVDLARNDLGVVAKPGTVKVTALKHIKICSRVMHISSTVNASLAKGKDALDALGAAFPAGTLSGAPKIRAMEIIETLEPQSRGLYGGVIGYIDNQGHLDSCIAIRMVMIKNGKAYVTAGAGITADSQLEMEAAETRHKAKAILEALAIVQGASL